MRVVSLVPAATEIAFALGAGDDLVAVTHDCDHPPAAARLPRITSSSLPADATSREIDDAVREAGERRESTFHLDAAALARAAPDLILGQTLCDVCAVTLRGLPHGSAPAVPLEAESLDGLLEDIRRVGRALGRSVAAAELIRGLSARRAALAGAPRRRRPRVAPIEWLDPPYNGGHWVPEQVELAGGIDVLGAAGARSRALTWDGVRAAQPDVIVAMPCGWSVKRALPEARALIPDLGVPVWLVDGNAYFSRPGPRLVDGAELLAAILHGGPTDGAVRLR